METPDVEILARCPLFRGLSAAARRDVARASSIRQLDAGAFFCHEGDPVNKLGVLVRGKLSVTRLVLSGEQVILRFIGPGDVFSYAHALSGAPAVASIEAIEDSAALEWDADTLIVFMRRYPTVTRSFATAVVEHTREMWTHLEEALTESCEQRLVRILLREQDLPPADARGAEIRLTERQIAEYLGVTPFTISRIVSGWRRKGIIGVRRGRIRILAPEKLSALRSRSS